jgi:hypothetical protein
MIITIEEFKKYLAEMSTRADEVSRQGWPEATNVESLAAQMWKQFLPHALAFWTIAGTLNLIAETLDPPKEDEDEDDNEGDTDNE